MNLFSKRTLYLALFMVAAVGFQSFAADLVENLQEAKRIVAEAEAEYAEKEAALAAAKNVVLDAKANLADAEAALANARTSVEVARAAEAEIQAQIDAIEAQSSAVVPPAATAPTVPATPATPPPASITPTERGDMPDSIRRNEYFLESERYLALAQEAYNTGDYDTATEYAEEAARLARLSDEYITQHTGVLPATYTVRRWDTFGDCFWNIAGQPWAYNNPYRWRVLYEANKEKLPDPNNPNIVEPGTVLTIPSIRGETRQGAWVGGRTYEPLR